MMLNGNMGEVLTRVYFYGPSSASAEFHWHCLAIHGYFHAMCLLTSLNLRMDSRRGACSRAQREFDDCH